MKQILAAIVVVALLGPGIARAAEGVDEYAWVEMDEKARKMSKAGGITILLGTILTLPGTGLIAAAHTPASDNVWKMPYLVSGAVLVGLGGGMLVTGIALVARSVVLKKRSELLRLQIHGAWLVPVEGGAMVGLGAVF